MADVRHFVTLGTIRCCHRRDPDAPAACATAAAWMTPPIAGSCRLFFCDEHRQATDVPIGGELHARRVSVVFEAVFCGISAVSDLAEEEAVAQVEAAIVGAGALPSIVSVKSEIVRYAAPAPPQRPRRVGGRG